MAIDFYKVLNVERTASPEEISKAYRKLARKYHPDLNQEDKNAKKRFQEIQQAYDCLNDPEKRKKFDQFGSDYEQYAGRSPFSGAHAGGQPGGGAGFDFGDIFGSGGAGGADFSDIFSQFAGGGAGGRTRRGAPAKGRDISAEIAVPLRTIIHGGETQIQLDRAGKLESLSVRVPAGIEPGKKIRLRGQGEPGPNGKPGDLLLKVNAEPNPNIKIVGQNLELRLPISITEAIEGARVDVPTPSGTVTLTIPRMSNSGKKLRIKGQGLKKSDGTAGDMTVELMIKLPDTIPDELARQASEWSAAYTTALREGIQF
jgi:DnaJ-class molecular chaperone